MQAPVALHPAYRALLDRAARLPPLHSIPLETLRATAAARFASKAERVAVAEVQDVDAPGGGGAIRMRLYRPSPTGAPPPLLVFFHGGAFVMCDLDTYDPLCRRLCRDGSCLVASVDYRLAPEHPFPAAVDDALAATLWLAGQAGALGFDGTRIVLAGDSAGGGLAGATAQALRDREPAIRAQMLLYPMLDAPDPTRPSYAEHGSGLGLDRAALERFWAMYVPRGTPTDPRATPLRAADLAGCPPSLIVVAGFDPLRDEGLAYADRLRAAGCRVTVQRRDDAIHGFLFAAGMLPPATDAWADIAGWLRAEMEAGRRSPSASAT